MFYRTYAFFHDNGHPTHCRRGLKPRLQWELRKSYFITNGTGTKILDNKIRDA